MTEFYQQLQKSTFRIQCGPKTGVGFSLFETKYLVTCYHVVEAHYVDREPIQITDEQGRQYEVKNMTYSPTQQQDYALFEITSDIADDRLCLKASKVVEAPRPNVGTPLLFTGYPLGSFQNLIHSGRVSGHHKKDGFFIEGAVMGGFSGSPILNLDTGLVVGILTWTKFAGGSNLQEAEEILNELREKIIAANIEPELFFDLGSAIFSLKEAITQDLNPGMGMAFDIDFVKSQFEDFELI